MLQTYRNLTSLKGTYSPLFVQDRVSGPRFISVIHKLPRLEENKEGRRNGGREEEEEEEEEEGEEEGEPRPGGSLHKTSLWGSVCACVFVCVCVCARP